jgi:hypothetical protein
MVKRKAEKEGEVLRPTDDLVHLIPQRIKLVDWRKLKRETRGRLQRQGFHDFVKPWRLPAVG